MHATDEQLLAFGRWVYEQTLECIRKGYLEMDMEDFADKMVELGVFQFVPYDPEKHGDREADPGEMIYFWGKGDE